ncbi:hypothetical protein BGZ46_005705 [Entomortierella lignicola]|nr:hypothetical protein BGZ46_005705 [Entomortierella lignicola]
MARQIVASLDVVKIIQRLGPKLVSTNTKNRSHAEAILVECMLSQTSDGLLGDGFISFIEYLRLEAMEAVSTSVLHIMESQGTVTEEILEEALESSDESVEDLRLARLSSLLILKTIPSRGFSLTSKMAIDSGNDENSISSRMTRALQTRSENPLEFSFVRTLAKAVMHVMFPDSSLEVIYAGLAKSCNQNSTRIEQIDLEETRSWLFALYDWVLNWNIQSNTLEQNEQAVIWLYQISREFFYKIAAFKSTADGRESDIYKLQLGVVDVLSRILLATAPFYCSSTPNSGLMSKLRKLSRNISCPSAEATIEEIVDDELVESGDDEETSELPKSPQDLFLALLYDVLEAISRPVFESQDTHIGISLCLVNVLIMLWQRLAPAPNPSSSTESPVSETKDSSDSIKLVPTTILDMLTPIISACIVFYFNSIETLSEKTYAQLIQGCFQILYTGVSVSSTADGKTVSGTTKQWIMNVMVMGINCTEFDIAVAALKLLATMSGSRMITRELLTEANLVGIRDGLLQMRKYNGSQQESNAAITSLLDKMWAMVA